MNNMDMDKTTAIILLVVIIALVAIALCPTVALVGIFLALLGG